MINTMDLSQIPNVSLKGVFTIHLVLTTWALRASWFSQTSYLFYNLVLLITLLWSIHTKDSEEPVHMAIHVNVVSIFLDLFFLITGLGTAYTLGEGFSYIICLIHLVFRLLSIYMLWRVSMERNSLVDPLPAQISNMFNSSSLGQSGPTMGSPYQDIGGLPHQSMPGNSFGPSVYNT
uniref:Uncharacterized protein n=1 Tax=Cacopsylla melanoneura TaxID=428564 RepID=A0A8D8R6A8_9HEMI